MSIKKVKPAPVVKAKKSPSKPKAKLSKKDPQFYSKIGAISAKKRAMTSAQFSKMAKRSHAPGVRKPKA